MSEQGPNKNPHLRIVRKREGYTGEESMTPKPEEVVKLLMDGDMSFSDEERQAKFEELKKLLAEAQTSEEKQQIEFAIRQLLLC